MNNTFYIKSNIITQSRPFSEMELDGSEIKLVLAIIQVPTNYNKADYYVASTHANSADIAGVEDNHNCFLSKCKTLEHAWDKYTAYLELVECKGCFDEDWFERAKAKRTADIEELAKL
jgi:hypothetical protein